MSPVFLHRKFFHRRIVLQGAAGVVKNHKFANVCLKYKSNRISSIKKFGACIPTYVIWNIDLKSWRKPDFWNFIHINCNILQYFARKSQFLQWTFFRKIVFQDALYVGETHNLVNGFFEYQIKRILSIKYFGARIPPIHHLEVRPTPQKQAIWAFWAFLGHPNPWQK